MPLPSPEIEFFCTCMHTIYNPGKSMMQFYGRLNRKQPDPSSKYAAPAPDSSSATSPTSMPLGLSASNSLHLLSSLTEAKLFRVCPACAPTRTCRHTRTLLTPARAFAREAFTLCGTEADEAGTCGQCLGRGGP